jgi:linoleoyl-CoA desaturase
MLNPQNLRFKTEPKNGFYATLRLRADAYFAQSGARRTGNWALWVKAVLLLFAYGLAYFCLLQKIGSVTVCYLLMGFLTVPIVLNIGHEAAHGTFSANQKLNAVLARIFYLVGAEGAIWKHRHVTSHHVFPNIVGWDDDIAQSKLVRIAPQSAHLPLHQYQHWYMPFLYLIYTLNWLIYRDFKDYKDWYGHTNGGRRLALLIGTKLFYIGYALALPLYLYPEAQLTIWAAFVGMQFVMSATTFLVLVSAHVGENAVFPQPDAQGRFDHTWSEHQLLTTTDFAPESSICTHLFGGFNHHVVHHLFPHVSHVHYPVLTALARDTAHEYDLDYQCFSSLQASVTSHFHFLKQNSLPASFFAEADI